VGVTPSAWFSTYKALQIGATTSLFNDGGTASRLSNNAIVNASGNFAYISTAAASYYQQGAGQHAWYNAPSGTAGNAITFTQAMTLDASGNVQLGLTTNPISSRLTVQGAASNIADFESTITTTNGGGIRVSNSGTTELWIGYYQFASNMGAGVTDAGLSARNNLLLDGTNAVLFGINGTEKARIDSNGNFLIGYTSSNGAYKLQVNSQIFATSSTIATSDANYKENVIPLTNALDLVKGLNPVQFSWKQHSVHNFDTTTPTVGFIAQEVQATLSQMSFVDSVVKQSEVTLPDKTKEQFLGIAEGNMIAILTAALKELSAQVTTLQTQVTALQTKVGV
jgi:hypothetical protein